MLRMKTRMAKKHERRAAVMVEFAIAAPVLLVSVIMPMFEFARALMVCHALATASEAGCRQGTLPGTSNAVVETTVKTLLSNQSIRSGVSTAVLVNGQTADVNTAVQGDAITLSVSVPYSSVSWLPTAVLQYLGNKTLGATQVMRHE